MFQDQIYLLCQQLVTALRALIGVKPDSIIGIPQKVEAGLKVMLYNKFMNL
jgi:hypothetical protein